MHFFIACHEVWVWFHSFVRYDDGILLVGQVWFYLSPAFKDGCNIPNISHTNSYFYEGLWWKKDHPLILPVDPGVQSTSWALSHLSRSILGTRQESEDTRLAIVRANTTRTATVGETLTVMLQEVELVTNDADDEDSDEESDNEEESYPPSQIDISAAIRGIVAQNMHGPGAQGASAQANKRKRGDRTRHARTEDATDAATEVEATEAAIEELDNLATFFDCEALAIQCDWCRKWRFVSNHFHEDVDKFKGMDQTDFQCHQLQWIDGESVGLSCESAEQHWQAPNPEDDNANKLTAQKAKASFFAWWKLKAEVPDDNQEEDLRTYQENYWEYLTDVGPLVPEGLADSDRVVF
jgi:hypothetical protein